VYPAGGAVGVDLFFVISGFLITSLLVREHDRTENISLRRFWARRALRLFPALACAIALALFVCLLSTEAVRHATVAGLPAVALYSGNWVRAFGSSPNTLGLLGHTWSLAVEEQFYLVWPLLCIAWVCRAKNRSRATALIVTLLLLDCLYLIFAMNHWGSYRGYYGTDTHAMGLLAGSALALVVSRASAERLRETKAAWLRIAGTTGLVLFLSVSLLDPHSETQSALMIIAATAASVLLVVHLSVGASGPLLAVFSSKPMTWVGQRSYGIYLYHAVIAGLLLEYCHWTGAPRDAAVAACVILVVALAELSYRFVESPFLRLKAHLASVPSVAEKGTATPSPSLLRAEPVSDT
jgi:peptidoglycan/LPS O-acetylase OafA/YrhL